jgi:hypothetical protein
MESAFMKSVYFLLIVLSGFGAGACNQPAGGSTTGDSAANRVIPPAPDNSQATNPSLADTAYPKKDTMVTRGDSARAKK